MPNKLLADLLGKTTSLWYPAVKDSINLMRLGMYTSRHLLEGSVVPAMQAVVSMQEQWVGGLEGALRGDQSYGELASDTWARLRWDGGKKSSLMVCFGWVQRTGRAAT